MLSTLYMELLPKMYGKIKILNSLLKSNALEHFKVLLEYGSKKKRLFWMWVANGTGWVLGARRQSIDGFCELESAEA